MTRLSPFRSVVSSRLALLAALVGLSSPVAGICADANPLIGGWKFTGTNNKFGPSACPSVFSFGAKTATITHPASEVYPGGSVQSMAVTYVPSPTLVFVMTNAAGHVNYNFVDRDHMYTEDAWGRCSYERTN